MWSAAEKDGWMLAECRPQVWLAAVFSCPCNQSPLFLWDVLLSRSLLMTLAHFPPFLTCASSCELFLVTHVQHKALLLCNSRAQQCPIWQLLHCLRDTKIQGPSRNMAHANTVDILGSFCWSSIAHAMLEEQPMIRLGSFAPDPQCGKIHSWSCTN